MTSPVKYQEENGNKQQRQAPKSTANYRPNWCALAGIGNGRCCRCQRCRGRGGICHDGRISHEEVIKPNGSFPTLGDIVNFHHCYTQPTSKKEVNVIV